MYPREEGPARAVLTQSSRTGSDPWNATSGAAELRAARAGPLLAVPPRAARRWEVNRTRSDAGLGPASGETLSGERHLARLGSFFLKNREGTHDAYLDRNHSRQRQTRGDPGTQSHGTHRVSRVTE